MVRNPYVIKLVDGYSVTRKPSETLSSVQAANANCASFAFTVFYFLRLSVSCCPLCYSLPCRNLVTPIKKRHAIQSILAIKLLLLHHTFYICAYHILFWWRWGESNSRPEHLSLCFIQQFLHYTLYLFTRQIYVYILIVTF